MAMHKRTCAICRARDTGLFCGLSGPVGERLQMHRTVEHVRRGQTIFREGAEATALFVVATGLVKVSNMWKGGTEHVLRVLGPGEILGYRPLLAEEPYSASAEAIEDTTVCVFRADAVCEALRDAPALAFELLTKLARELRRSEQLMLDLLHRRASERVARLLLALPEWTDQGPAATSYWSRGLTHKSMATLIGVTPETFSRALKALERKGVVLATRERIEIRDLAALRRAAGADRDQAGS